MTLPESSYSPERIATLTARGTRRLHLNTGEVWRVGEYDAAKRRLKIVREGGGEVHLRTIWLSYWLGDSWGRPRSRAGARAAG